MYVYTYMYKYTYIHTYIHTYLLFKNHIYVIHTGSERQRPRASAGQADAILRKFR